MRTFAFALGLTLTCLAACGDDDDSTIDASIRIDAGPDAAPVVPDATPEPDATPAAGALSFNGSNITLYHPTATPSGDISSQLTGAGNRVCAPVGTPTTSNYGTLATINFASAYIYANPPSQNDVTTHPEGAQTASPAFSGTYTTTAATIPPATTTTNFSFAFHATSGDYLVVQQQSQASSSVLSPAVILQFATTSTSVGTLTLGTDAMLVVLENPTSSTTSCIAAVGLGTLNITVATNTAP